MGLAAEASRSGDLLNDTYELCERLESSEVHEAYRARDTRTDRQVRVSVLRPEHALRSGVAQRFIQAPKALTQIDHPNLARVLSVETDVSGIPFVVEEVLDGQSLSAMLASFPEGLPLGVAMNVLPPVVEACAAVHSRSLCHGALDAEHVLLTEVSGSTVPKLLRSRRKSDSRGDLRDDVHALGALFYRALTGQAPAAGKRRVALDELAPHLPNELTSLVERCLASPDERPADARSLCDELSTLRQRFGGRSSAVHVERVSSERAVAEDRPRPTPTPTPIKKPSAPARAEPARAESVRPKVALGTAEVARRKAVERAATEPVVDPIVDPIAATAFDATAFALQAPVIAAAPMAEPAPQAPAFTPPAVQQARTSASEVIEFSMAGDAAPTPHEPTPSAAAPVAEPPPAALAAVRDEPVAQAAVAQTRSARGKEKKKAKPRAASGPAIAVAGPARLAAAFGPLDGASAIEQGESAASELSRAFRESLEEQKQKPRARSQGAAQAGPDPAAAPRVERQAAQSKADAQKALVNAIAFSKLQTEVEQRRKQRDELINAALMLLFALGLARAVPLMSEASGDAARALLGTQLKLTAGVFSALTVVVLVRTWALQIQGNVALLKPVLMTFKVVAACVCVLALGYFLPAGALGPAGRAARLGLPFASAFFFLFLGLYGLMQGMQQLRSNALMGAATLILYSASFVGSFQVTQGVIIPSLKKKPQAVMNAQVAQQLGIDPTHIKDTQLSPGSLDPRALENSGHASAEDGFQENKMTGGNEEEDLKSIREMGDARKRNSKKLDQMNEKLPSLME
jgi:serine/threonine-protein kinase